MLIFIFFIINVLYRNILTLAGHPEAFPPQQRVQSWPGSGARCQSSKGHQFNQPGGGIQREEIYTNACRTEFESNPQA